MIIGKIYRFDAAHFLPNHPKCGALHGHTWKVKVDIEGQVAENGMVMDFEELDSVMKDILKNFDHTNLNDLINHPTCEVIATMIWSSLKVKIPNHKVHSVTVQEGIGGFATFVPKEKK